MPPGRGPERNPLEAAIFDYVAIHTLEGRAGERESVWIKADDGQQISVVWPQGFSVRFEPDAVLYDDRGKRVARAGERIELGQVRQGDHAGRFDDPYIASGILFDGCHPFMR